MTGRRPSPAVIRATVALLCLIWGSTWSVIQIGLRDIPPFTGVSIRFALAAFVLLALAFARGVRIGRTARERRLWIANGVLSFTLSYGIVYWAEQWVPSGLTAVLFATYPLLIGLLAHLALPDEPLTRIAGIGSLIGFAGVGVIFSEDLTLLGGPGVALASAVMLLAPLASAAGSVVVKRWGGDVHPLSITAVPMGICAGLTGGAALLLERGRETVWNTSSIGALLYLSLAGSAITFTLYYWLLTHLPATRLALIAYVVPVVAITIGTLRGEPLTPRVLAGAGLVVAGVALAVRRPVSRPPGPARSRTRPAASAGPRTTG